MSYSVFTSVRRPPSDGVTFDSTYNQKNIAYFATKFARDNIVPWKKNMPK